MRAGCLATGFAFVTLILIGGQACSSSPSSSPRRQPRPNSSHRKAFLARVEFRPERRQNPEWYHMLGRREAMIAGEPAVIVDYTVKVPERPHTYSAREAYFVHNSHLFICMFIGLQESLAVFEAVLASIEFPK